MTTFLFAFELQKLVDGVNDDEKVNMAHSNNYPVKGKRHTAVNESTAYSNSN
jgi:hypothetical protein